MPAVKKNLSKAAIRRIHNMIAVVEANKQLYTQNAFPENNEATVCNTPYCAAGHLIFAHDRKQFHTIVSANQKSMADWRVDGYSWATEARKLLGLEDRDNRGASVTMALFGSSDDWPKKYSQAYDKAKTYRGRFNAFKRYWLRVIEVDADLDKLFGTE